MGVVANSSADMWCTGRSRSLEQQPTQDVSKGQQRPWCGPYGVEDEVDSIEDIRGALAEVVPANIGAKHQGDESEWRHPQRAIPPRAECPMVAAGDGGVG